MTPSMAMYGRESRTSLAAACDWSAVDFGKQALGVKTLTFADVNELIAEHHAAIEAAQSTATLATSVEQAVTKRIWDSTHSLPSFAVGEWVLVRTVAPNRLAPWMTGPYRVTAVEQDGNVVRGRHFVDNSEAGPFHVSRLQRIDMSRATRAEVASYQLEAGSAVVDSVLAHRILADGSYEYHIKWYGTEGLSSWVPSGGLKLVTKVIDYCVALGLPRPGMEMLKKPVREDAAGRKPVREAAAGRELVREDAAGRELVREDAAGKTRARKAKGRA